MIHQRTAEKITILKDIGHGILERIHQAKKVFGSPQRPSFVADPQYQKVVQALTSKFPDFFSSIEKVRAYYF